AKLASAIYKILPIMLVAIGAFLIMIGRGGLGIPLAAIGLGIWQRMRGVGKIKGGAGGTTSTVRSAAFEMHLDHDSGEMDGRVLIGDNEGLLLSQLDDEALMGLYADISSDPESVALFEAYLDRRLSGWRENTQSNSGSGQAHPASSGSMTKQEAYQVLGLEPGASPAEIRKAWRKLMKSMHPDSGGSEFLAAKINAAKDILLD
ncbi:MAG: DnaJ domain-containing protein, partial [Salaquimonas sp.]